VSFVNSTPTDICAAGYTLVVAEAEYERLEIEAAVRGSGPTVAAASLDEVFAQAEVGTPSLVVLCDLGGPEARRHLQDRLRRHPRLADVPLLVLGDEDDRASFARAIAHGASAYLAKPVSDEVLASVAQKLCAFRSESPLQELRRHARRPFLVPIELEVRARPARVTGWMLDASHIGCRVETPEAMAKGDQVRVWRPAAEATAHTPLAGEARWARRAELGLSVAGIRFSETASLLAGLALGLESLGEAS
jgi:CheY-like chemotaxis protein